MCQPIVTPDAYEPVLDRLCTTRAGPIGVAVSGGSDSVALLSLANRWAQYRGADLLAMTFDHRLRAGSAQEARQVAQLCETLGVAHMILSWDTPVANQAAARRARHAALASAVRTRGGRQILFGHTRDDQAETFLLRARRKSGWYGLAGMQPVSVSPVWPEGAGVAIIRPLLGIRRADLRLHLEEQDIAWSDDPSNENPAFERVRARQRLIGNQGIADGVERCLPGLQILRSIEDALLARWVSDCVEWGDEDVRIDVTGLPVERAARALGLMIQIVGQGERAPRQDALIRLARRMCAPRAFAGATLGGVKLEQMDGCFRLSPEASLSKDNDDFPCMAARLQHISCILSGHYATIAAA